MNHRTDHGKSRIETEHEDDFAHAGKRLVARLWLAGAAITAATAIVQTSIWLFD
jgi:hypothetical protein